jgi:hypothetical protein
MNPLKIQPLHHQCISVHKANSQIGSHSSHTSLTPAWSVVSLVFYCAFHCPKLGILCPRQTWPAYRASSVPSLSLFPLLGMLLSLPWLKFLPFLQDCSDPISSIGNLDFSSTFPFSYHHLLHGWTLLTPSHSEVPLAACQNCKFLEVGSLASFLSVSLLMPST